MESLRNWRTGAIITGIAIVLSLVFLSVWPLVKSSGDGLIGQVPDDVRSLIANPPSVDCVALATKYDMPPKNGKVVLTYIPNKVDTADPTARDFSDAVNISAIPADRDRVNASICSQPEEAGMVGVALATHYPIFDQLNPNLFGQFVGTTPKEWADKVFNGTIPYDDATKTMTQLAGLMTIFTVSYEKGLSTAWNYHATPEMLTTKANVRSIVVNPNQYTGDFEKYRISWKGMVGCEIEFGINVGIGGDITKGDQRIAGFTCVTPPKSTPPPHGHPTPTPTPSLSCLSVYGSKYPHGTYPVCKDDAGDGPSHHGNDGGNGGKNQNPGLDPTNTPTPVPSATRTNPASPSPSASPTGSTPAPTVTATPTPEGGNPDAPQ